MKTYKYNKFLVFFFLLIVIAIEALIIIFVLPMFEGDNRSSNKLRAFFVLTPLLLLFYIIMLFNRSVTLTPNYILISNIFYNKGIQKELKIFYCDVNYIEKNFLSNALFMSFKNQDDSVSLGPYMKNHKELFGEICRRVRNANPDAYIDSGFDKYYLNDMVLPVLSDSDYLPAPIKYDKERMNYLLSDAENLIWSEIHTYTDNKKKPAHSVEFIKYMIECFISLSNETGQPVDYSGVKDFFLVYDSDGNMEKEYNKFISSKSQVDERIESDKVLFWINYMKSHVCKFIHDVLLDSECDPHYSAVYAANIIKCIIYLLKESGNIPEYSDVKGFFVSNGFTLDEYDTFEAIREKESVYYRGIQY